MRVGTMVRRIADDGARARNRGAGQLQAPDSFAARADGGAASVAAVAAAVAVHVG